MSQEKKIKVAFQIMGIGPSIGGGGAQRFFGMLSQDEQFMAMGIEPYLLTDDESHETFKTIGSIFHNKNVLTIPIINNRFYKLIQSIAFLWHIIKHRFDIIHIGNYNGFYDHLSHALRYLPKGMRPKLILNIVDCRFAHYVQKYLKEGNFEDFHFQGYLDILKDVHFDGIYSWYKNIMEIKDEKEIFQSDPFVSYNEYCYTDYSLYYPAEKKEKHMLFAAFLSPLKNPLMFVESLKILFAKAPELVEGWTVSIYGRGALEGQVRENLKTYGLADRVQVVNDQNKMSLVFPYTKLFISTQNFENFTSLSMLEAMAAGNAVVARNVGQTDYFLKDGENGIMAKEDTPEGVADALIEYLQQEDKHEFFQENSRRIAVEHYSKDNFLKDLLKYYQQILGQYKETEERLTPLTVS